MADVLPLNIVLADIGVDCCYVYYSIGLMLCPLADVIAILYNHRSKRFRADVTVLDWLWLMLLPSGRWNSHRVNYIV